MLYLSGELIFDSVVCSIQYSNFAKFNAHIVEFVYFMLYVLEQSLKCIYKYSVPPIISPFRHTGLHCLAYKNRSIVHRKLTMHVKIEYHRPCQELPAHISYDANRMKSLTLRLHRLYREQAPHKTGIR